MLIVNGDDLGAAPSATDAIIAAFEHGGLSSASAMVWMRDSVRAAALAAERGLPLGLHLNLTLAFADPGAPPRVRERQLRLTEALGRDSWMRDDRLDVPATLVRDAVQDQLERYREQYGEPTHVNGHHHIHVHRGILEHLPAGVPVRPVMRMPAQADMRSSGRERALRRRYSAAALAVAFEHVHPALGGSGFGVLERYATDRAVEVMTHPQQRRELEALLSDDWLALLARLPVGSYSDLERGR